LALSFTLSFALSFGSQLDSQLYSQLYSQLRSQLGSQLDSQLYSQLRSQLGFTYETGSNWINYYYWHYDFILNEIFPNKKNDFELFSNYLETTKNYHYIYLSPDLALFSDFPDVIEVNKEGILDNDSGKALRYRDGYGIYVIDGKVIKDNSPVMLALDGIIIK
jgi:hypothetical protein